MVRLDGLRSCNLVIEARHLNLLLVACTGELGGKEANIGLRSHLQGWQIKVNGFSVEISERKCKLV